MTLTRHKEHPSRLRPLAVLIALCLVGALVTESLRRLALPALAGPVTGLADGRGLGEIPFGAVLSATCALALLGCWAWLMLTSLLVATEVAARTVTGRRILPRTLRLCPSLFRAALLAALGVSVAATVTATVAIAPASADGTGTGQVPPATPLTGLAIPDRTPGRPPTAPPVTGATRSPRVLVVQRGDCLWELTARRMPGASDASIARGWRRLYAANRTRVGPDPDLILPGTRLVVPAPGGQEPR